VCGWVVNATSRSLYPPGKRSGFHFTGGWVGLGAGLDWQKKFAQIRVIIQNAAISLHIKILKKKLYIYSQDVSQYLAYITDGSFSSNAYPYCRDQAQQETKAPELSTICRSVMTCLDSCYPDVDITLYSRLLVRSTDKVLQRWFVAAIFITVYLRRFLSLGYCDLRPVLRQDVGERWMNQGFISFVAESPVPFGVALQFFTSFCSVIKSDGITRLMSK
jgi:hypothetical protein